MAEETYEEMMLSVYGPDGPSTSNNGLASKSDQVDLRQTDGDFIENWFAEKSGKPITELKAEPVEDVFESPIKKNAKLKQEDLMRPQNLNTIREYMVAKNGIDYEDYDADKVVDDFVENMRWFNTNTISTAGEVVFMNRANQREKQVAGEAYKLYDKLGSFWENDGLYGRAEGIFDYVSAAALDPSNYIGLLTGGLAKAGTLTIAQGGKAAVKKAAADAAKRAVKTGASKEAAEKAGKEAAESVARKLEKFEVSGPAAKKAKEQAVNNAKRLSIAATEQAAAKLVTAEASKKAGRNALIATAITDGAIAFMQDDSIQDIYIEANYQEQYNRSQAIMTTALGGLLGPLAQYGAGKLKGSSGLGAGVDKLDLLERAGDMEDFLPMLEKKTQRKAADTVRKAYDSWAKKVQRGEKLKGGSLLPETVFREIMLGPDGKSGLAQIAREAGVKIPKTKTVSDIMTNIIRYLPEEDFIEISNLIEGATAIKMGDLASNQLEFGDVIASSISDIGSSLSVMSEVKRKLNKTVIGGNDILNAAVSEIDAKKLDEAINAKPLGYAQNVWKRLLVSSPATTAANVAGFGSFALGQMAADMMNAGMVGAWGVVSRNPELLRQSKVYARIQGQKMRNFADPMTTYSAYEKLLEAKPDVKKVLFETVGTGVERTGDRYGINPKNKLVFGKYGVEKIVGAANDLTGVRIQDSLTKSQMFMAEVDKYLDLKHGRTLSDVLAKGDLDIIDEDITGLALDTTMKSVFAKDYTTKATTYETFRGLAKVVETISSKPGLGLILPFGRFMNNVVASAYQWSPLAYAGIASDISKKSVKPIKSREAFARATVGTSALLYASKMSESQEEQGLGTFELRQGSTIVDVTNIYPLSYLLAAGKVVNYSLTGKAVTPEMKKDLGEQLAIGQISRDVQFGTDLSNILDYFIPTGGTDTGGERVTMMRDFYNAFTEPGSEIGEDDGVMKRMYEFGSDTAEAIGKPVGNIVAGAFRPLDPINKLVGFITETDTAKDTRQARGFGKFNQSATKYFDNILEAIGGETKNITGESLRVASREGEIYDPNPLARIFGLKLLPGRTATEKTYSLSGIKSWSKDQRSNIPAYDRIFNETMAPLLERRMGKLLNDPKFKKMDIGSRRDKVNDEVQQVRSIVKRAVQDSSTGETYLDGIRYKTLNNGNSAQRTKVLKEMREAGIKANIKDFNYEELKMFNAKVDLLKLLAKQ